MKMHRIGDRATATVAVGNGCAMSDGSEEPRQTAPASEFARGRRRPARPMRRLDRVGRGPTRKRLAWVRCPSSRRDDTAREHPASYEAAPRDLRPADATAREHRAAYATGDATAREHRAAYATSDAPDLVPPVTYPTGDAPDPVPPVTYPVTDPTWDTALGPPQPPPPTDDDAPPPLPVDPDRTRLVPSFVGPRTRLPAPSDPDVLPPPPDDDEAPLIDLEVLRDVPELADLLLGLREVDRLIAANLHRLRALIRSDLAPRATGVGLSAWMALVGRRTTSDIRMLRTAVKVMDRVPSLRAAFEAGQVSWAQVRSIVLAVERLPQHLDDRIDGAVAAGICGAAGGEPDSVTAVIRWELASLHPKDDESAQSSADAAQYLGMQPRLDGTGGRFWGEAGPEAWAVLDAALNTASSPPDRATRDGFAGDPLDDGERPGAFIRRTGRERLDRLVSLLDATLEGGSATADPNAATTPDGSRPQLLLRADLDALLDRSAVPASLLTTLIGGQVRVTAATARRLIDERGADLRTVVIDDTGAVVGVGRRTRLAPGWLRDATLAVHDTCSAPTCNTAARLCHTDHARPWHPARPDDLPGRTDIDQLAPLCARDNAAKERQGWRAEQRADGSRRWTHERSGISTRTLPATWRPPPGGARALPDPSP